MIKLKKIKEQELKDYPNAIATIAVGRHEAQLTAAEIIQLKYQLNKFALHNVKFSEKRAEVCATCRFNKKDNAVCDFCNERFSKYYPAQT